MSRTIKQGRTIEHEFMQVHAGAGGRLAYVAYPSGQRSAIFPLLRIGDTEVVFENPQHDFPQRVAYRLDGPSRLVARIEGVRGGSPRVIEFPMTRIGCDPVLAR